MSSGRRYTEDEMRAIFARASEAEPEGERLAPAPAGGMTLEELQSIGQEVGISAERVAQAATALDGSPPSAGIVRRLAGLPIGVGRTVELGRRLTDDEWDRLVSELRETFDARGTVRQEGGLRYWTNGNLQVYLEPSGDGHRLRLRTVKGSALAFMQMGAGFVAGSGVLALVAAMGGRLAQQGEGLLLVAIAGAVAIVGSAVRLPSWARERARQMDRIAAKVSALSPDLP